MTQKRRLKRKRISEGGLKSTLSATWAFLVIGFCIFAFGYDSAFYYFISRETIITRGVIIDKMHVNSALGKDYTYYYRFKVNGKVYERDSQDKRYHVGDSVAIKYVPFWPRFSKAVKDQ